MRNDLIMAARRSRKTPPLAVSHLRLRHVTIAYAHTPNRILHWCCPL